MTSDNTALDHATTRPRESRPYPDKVTLSPGIETAYMPAPSRGRNKRGYRDKNSQRQEQRRIQAYQNRLIQAHNRLTDKAWRERAASGEQFLLFALHGPPVKPLVFSREICTVKGKTVHREIEFYTYTEAMFTPGLADLIRHLRMVHPR